MSENIGVLEKRPKVRIRSRKNVINDKKYKVIFHNDEETYADFVELCLMKIFDKNLYEAKLITKYIDKNGNGVVGIYPMEEARRRVEEADKMKKKYGMPLLITVDEE